MKPSYHTEWLIEKYYSDEPIKFLFFWGHNKKPQEQVGKFCFSQWFELPFMVDGITYKTAEHWMMANKALLFGDQKHHDKIVEANHPGEVKELGRMVWNFDELIWRDYRYQIVVNGNIHKFNQHPEFAQYLINTGDRILVEASPVDTIWGVGLAQDNEHINDPNNWRGLNLLGFALMEVRGFLKEHGHFKGLESAMKVPWKEFPGIHPYDLFWRMGGGEDYVTRFSKYYDNLSDWDKHIFRLSNPQPYDWRFFYDGPDH
jgi:ribA/ribD-fused uncharacterized protein